MEGPDVPKKPRRRSEKRQRTALKPVRWLASEFEEASARADRAGLTFAAFIRSAALGEAGPRAQRRPPVDHRELRRIMGEIGRIGNNVNQGTHALHGIHKLLEEARQSGNWGPQLDSILYILKQIDTAKFQQSIDVYLDVRNAILEALGKNSGSEP